MMKYFFDTEFIEWTGGIDLVSIGIVSEAGDTFYAESTNFDERNADQWVKDNVLSKLRFWNNDAVLSTTLHLGPNIRFKVFGSDMTISKEILNWMEKCEQQIGRKIVSSQTEFYAYYADYDWVVLCRLFGRMIDLPKGFPLWCRDLKQMMWERDLDIKWKNKHCPDPDNEHNALIDAMWNKDLYELIMEHPIKQD